MKAELSGWHSSSYSGPQGNCVEVGGGFQVVGVRDTKDRAGGTLTFTRSTWSAFLSTIKEHR